MPYKVKPLTQVQTEVLQWVADGCPDGVFSGYAHRVSARALAGMSLLTVTGRGATWRATLTDDGAKRLARVAEAAAPSPAAAEADRLLRMLIDAGAAVEAEVPRRDGNEVMRAAMDSPIRPKGTQLRLYAANWLEDFTSAALVRYVPDEVEEQPVAVPERVAKLHPVAAAFKQSKENVSAEHLPRAARIVHAVAVEAERRGYAVTLPSAHKKESRYVGRAETHTGAVAIETGEVFACLTVRELPPNKGAARPYSEAWDPSKQEYVLRKNKAFEPTGVIEIEITVGVHGPQQTRFRDGKRRSLDEQLPSLLRQIEIQHREDEAARNAQERQKRLRRERWEAAMAQARLDIQEHHRATILDDQVQRWQRARAYEDYIHALAARTAELHDPAQRAGAEAWIEWATRYVHSVDPANDTIGMPQPVKHTDADLAPFLHGWNPYGPER